MNATYPCRHNVVCSVYTLCNMNRTTFAGISILRLLFSTVTSQRGRGVDLVFLNKARIQKVCEHWGPCMIVALSKITACLVATLHSGLLGLMLVENELLTMNFYSMFVKHHCKIMTL